MVKNKTCKLRFEKITLGGWIKIRMQGDYALDFGARHHP